MVSLPHTRDVSVEEALGVAVVAHILGVHPRTIERRRVTRKALRPIEAQREEKLLRIWREMIPLFTPENAVYWLKLRSPSWRTAGRSR
jgi:uncharacterized protein (DUF2384 family)